MTALRSLAGASPTLAAAAVILPGLLLAPGLQAQASVEAETGRSSVGASFFGPESGSAGRSGSGRRGTGLESLRGDPRPDRGRRTVPVNVNTVANGTANDPIERPQRSPRRPVFRGGVGTTLVQVNNQVTVVTGGSGTTERRRAVRRGEALRKRSESAAERRERPAASPSPTTAPAPATRSERTAPEWTPLVKPLATARNGDTEEIDVRNCAVVRITTAGGIEWRHRVALDGLGASSVSGAASLLQSDLRAGDPLVLESPEGAFSVPARLVESLIVGPCR